MYIHWKHARACKRTFKKNFFLSVSKGGDDNRKRLCGGNTSRRCQSPFPSPQVFRIRELAMCIIGRLSSLNPAFVMPTLRKVLIQILTELEYSGVGRNKEQSAKLLGHLVANAPKLVRPYHAPILKVY